MYGGKIERGVAAVAAYGRFRSSRAENERKYIFSTAVETLIVHVDDSLFRIIEGASR